MRRQQLNERAAETKLKTHDEHLTLHYNIHQKHDAALEKPTERISCW